MTLTTKQKVIVGGVALATSFAFGRYSALQDGPPAVHETKSQQVQVNKDIDKDIHETTKTITLKRPDGATVTTVVQQKDTVSHEDVDKKVDTHTEVTVTPPKHTSVNISLLAGVDPRDGFKPTYGLSAQTQVLGPVTVGAFGLMNGTIGVSVGLNF